MSDISNQSRACRKSLSTKNHLKSGSLVFIVKKHQGPHGIVLVITDKEIIGKKFEENNLQLDLTKEFYQGEELNEEQVKEKIKEAYILHLTGEKTIQLFLDLGLINPEKILIVSKIPHAEVYLEEN